MPIEAAKGATAEHILQGRNSVLERIALGDPLPDVLEALAFTSEAAVPGMLASILLLDASTRTLHHGAAPSLPRAYSEAVDGMSIGLSMRSCGACAFTGACVIVEDVMSHSSWRDHLPMAAAAHVRACWSAPIRSARGALLGTFAMYYVKPKAPTEFELDFIHATARVASVAIQRAHAETELVHERHRLEGLVAERMVELERANGELRRAVENVKTLSGMLPICAACKSIRDDQGYWERIEAYISERSDVVFSHSICPSCAADLYPHPGASGPRDVEGLLSHRRR